MPAIYLDESGDMGFDFTKSKTTKFFVITCLFVTDHRPVEKIAKKIIREFSPAERKRHNGVLHANKEQHTTRRRLLTSLAARSDVSVVAIYLNKEKVHTRLQDQQHILYNFVSNILLDRLCRQSFIPNDEDIMLVASKRETKQLLNDNFKSYLENQPVGARKVPITVDVKTPVEDKCLQIVDFVSWAIFRNREFGDDTYYKLIRNIIVHEAPLFP